MSLTTSHRIANLLIWLGLLLVVVGCAWIYPFVRDAIEAQSDPSVSLSFAVTLTPSPTLPAVAVDTSMPTPMLAPTATASQTPAPTYTRRAPAPTVTSSAIPSPAVLPDDSTSGDGTPLLITVPASTTMGIPPDRIVIPAIGLDAPVVTVGWHIEGDVSVWDVPDRRAAGWLKTSALAGQPGNTVLDGHHNIRGEVFRRLVDLKAGNVIDLYAHGTVYHYAVTEKHILLDRGQPLDVRISNARWIQPTDDDQLTLVTCWPYTNNTHRLIIVARPRASALTNRTPEGKNP